MHIDPRVFAFCLATMMGTSPAVAIAEAHTAEYELRPFEDLEFSPFGEGPLEIALLWGDPTTGASGYFLRIPAGFEAPLHSHTASYRAIVIEGQAMHWLDGDDKMAVAPVGVGGYWLQPGGQLHGDKNPSNEDTLALIIFDGPVDFLMSE
jgi:quercetin dioxygenase-like cupin family protein